MNNVIFTDLDGTLLDESTYSYEPAYPALKAIEEKGVPLIFCSSKTRSEIEYYRRELNNAHPFISENGGAIFIPHGYFPFSFPHSFALPRYQVIELGAPYPELRTALKTIQQENGFILKGFGDMSAAEVSAVTGLSREEAERSKQREYDEPFIIVSGEESEVIAAIVRKGYQVPRAGFFHILSGSHKGKAVSLLTNLYKTKLAEVRTIALGDSLSDLPMLETVDVPIVVQKAGGTYDPGITLRDLRKAPGTGPAGWNRAILEFLS